MNHKPIVQTTNLQKSFKFQNKSGGVKGWLKPQYTEIEAVKSINLSINNGEMVAFVGPNGAGKSTTIKMLSGILSPTSGSVHVCGHNPLTQRQQLSYKIGCVFGQRSQLLPNLPLKDSLELFGKMYDLTDTQITKRIAELSDIFDLHKIVDQPVRQLSLGQRMRGEVVACIMHKPLVVFLDEPTIGLDVIAKRRLRTTLKNLNDNEGTTVFLTSHDTGDIEALAKRTIVIDRGTIIVDEPTHKLKSQFLNKKYLKIDFENAPSKNQIKNIDYAVKGKSLETAIDMSTQNINDALGALLKLGTVADIQIFDESLEEVILQIYKASKQNEGP